MLTVICAVKGGLRQTGATYHSAAYPKGKPDGECSMSEGTGHGNFHRVVVIVAKSYE